MAQMIEEHDPIAEIASLRRQVAELEEAKAELQAIFQAMKDVVLVMSSEGRYLKIAPTGPDLLYKPSDELLGKTVHDVMPAANANFFVASIREALERRRVVTVEYTLPIQDREVFFLGHISPMSQDTVVFVARDISEQRRAQRALEESRDELIRAQEVALAERSTPLIPISDEIVVMPLIGALDSRRMDQALQALLDGIQDKRARVAILDVTGVPTIDAQVAEAVVRVAGAVQLLGARAILTGLRPEVARTLVTIGADLGGIATRGTLQDGIAHAMTGQRWGEGARRVL